jgi:hypothetical protein
VDELKKHGVDCIKAILESGAGGMVYNRLDTGLFDAVAKEGHADSLQLAVHTGDVRDVFDALKAQASSIEHGSFRDKIPDELFAEMAKQGILYDPTLSVGEAFKDIVAGNTDLLKRSLVQPVGPADLLRGTAQALTSSEGQEIHKELAQYSIDMAIATDNLKRAHNHGVLLVTRSDAGNILVIHGPTVQHEMEFMGAGRPGRPFDVSGVAGGNIECGALAARRKSYRSDSHGKRCRSAAGRRKPSGRHHCSRTNFAGGIQERACRPQRFVRSALKPNSKCQRPMSAHS